MSAKPLLVEQLIAEHHVPKLYAQQVAMLSQAAEAGRSLMAAARAAGLHGDIARSMADRFGITFQSSGAAGPAGQSGGSA